MTELEIVGYKQGSYPQGRDDKEDLVDGSFADIMSIFFPEFRLEDDDET